jgi:AcrR family transcriptional regulator
MTAGSADLRTRLVLAGADLVRSEGLPAVTLREIARRAGVSHGAPRRWFPTHRELLSAIARTGFADLAERCSAALAGTDASAREQLVVLARTYVEFAGTEGGMFELMFRHDLLDSGALGLRETSLPLFARLTELVAAARPRATPPTAVVAAALWANVHGIAQLWTWRSLPLALGPADPDDLVRAGVAAHLDAP